MGSEWPQPQLAHAFVIFQLKLTTYQNQGNGSRKESRPSICSFVGVGVGAGWLACVSHTVAEKVMTSVVAPQ